MINNQSNKSNNYLKILHLEDNDMDAELIAEVLKEEKIRTGIKRVTSKDDFEGSLKNNKYDLILADYSLPDFDGMSALKYAYENYPHIPFIFVSGTLGEERAIDSLKKGATDYVVKQRLKSLGPAIFRAIEEVREKTRRAKAEEKVHASLAEKEILLKEIHHRVKNNLQIIISLLNLQLRKIKDEDIRNLIRSSQNRVKSMAIIHEILYKSEDLGKLVFSEYVNSLIKQLLISYGVSQSQLNIDIKVDKINLDMNTAIPCGLIINEVVSNSLKYAFDFNKKNKTGSEERRISIELHPISKKKFELKLSDNGQGIPVDFDMENSTSLGLHLVKSLTEQINGQLEIDRDNGTHYKITF
jgi:two-component sensor histidine kinase